ncbi:MAG: hypothetical protein AAF587_18430 [Bacteroidota bacterium]
MNIHQNLLILFLFAFLGTGLCFAQQNKTEEVVYLKNGSIIRGKILEQNIGAYVRIQVLGGQIFTLAQADILEIKLEPALYTYTRVILKDEYRPIQYSDSGMYYQLVADIGFYQGKWGGQASSALSVKAGYSFHRLLKVGIGTGFHGYEGGTITPIMLDIQGNLAKQAGSPHFFANVGYGFAIGSRWTHDVFQGGPMGQIGAGFSFHTRTPFWWTLTMGYRIQKSYEEFQDWPPGRTSPGGQWIQPDPVLISGTRLNQRIVVALSVGL